MILEKIRCKCCAILFLVILLLMVTGHAIAENGSFRTAPPLPIAEGLAPPAVDSVAAGYVYSHDGDLYRDGKKIKFWGVNCVSEFWREKEDQIRILDRIKALGFNAMRVHLVDSTLVDPDGPGDTINDYELGDNSLMDKYDYFLSEAYKRGLMVWFTLDRRRVSFKPETYDILPAEDDEQEWKDAMQAFYDKSTSPGYFLEQLWPMNPRLEAVYIRYVKNLLSHRNKYTGLTYAEEPGIALWEISNEGNCVIGNLDGSLYESLKDHPYWRNAIEKLWNEFLREHYKNDSGLLQAWGDLMPGESLADGTIKLEPMPVPLHTKKPNREEAEYPSRRVSDLVTFVVNRFVESNNRVWQAMRDSAPKGKGAAVVPVTFDTHFRPTLHNLYGVSEGSFVSVGAYNWFRTYDKTDPLYPITSMLTNKPSLYGMDMGNVADKPMVTYEFNVHKPAPYRAEIPYIMASYISNNDWDGFFWYHWMNSSQATPKNNDELLEMPLIYDRVVDRWGGVVVSSDEVLVSAIRMAGKMFMSDSIRKTDNPVRFVVGHRQFVDPNIDIKSIYKPMKIASWTRGMDIDFSLNGSGSHVSETSPVSWSEGEFRIGRDVVFDDVKRQLIIDSPTAHAFVGWPDESVITFESGLQISGYPIGKFVAFSVVSEDAGPIANSKHLSISAQSTSENTGHIYDPLASKEKGFKGMLQGLVKPGGAPVIFDRPTLTVKIPGQRVGMAHLYNAFPERIAEQPFQGEFTFDGEQPIAWVEIVFE